MEYDFTDRHPNTQNVLRWFECDHLPPHLRAVVGSIRATAYHLADQLPDSPELVAGLRKLLEGKDCLVRAAVEAKEKEDAPS